MTKTVIVALLKNSLHPAYLQIKYVTITKAMYSYRNHSIFSAIFQGTFGGGVKLLNGDIEKL